MKLSVVRRSRKSMPRRRKSCVHFSRCRCTELAWAVPDVLTGEVQEHVSARFRVFQNDAPGVRQVKFHGVRNADGNEVVLEVELAQGRLVVFSPEVADHDDHGGFFLGEDELLRHLGDALVRPVVFAGHDFTHDAQRLFHALGGGDVAGLASAVDEQAAFVPALGRAEGEHRRDFRRVVQFGGAGEAEEA